MLLSLPRIGLYCARTDILSCMINPRLRRREGPSRIRIVRYWKGKTASRAKRASANSRLNAISVVTEKNLEVISCQFYTRIPARSRHAFTKLSYPFKFIICPWLYWYALGIRHSERMPPWQVVDKRRLRVIRRGLPLGPTNNESYHQGNVKHDHQRESEANDYNYS